jgi:hypothetical protein
MNAPHSSSRRDFLSDLALGTGAALAFTPLDPADAAAERLAESAAEWDMSWVDRLTGKYRAVFDSPDINEGTVFTNATVFMSGFQEVYKVGDADTQAVIVMRHIGVSLAFNDAMWEKYGIAADLKVPNAETKNPYTTQLAGLKARGATLIACNLAANRQAGVIAQRVGAPRETVRADIFANLIPGTIVMPSGVFATLRAEMAGCSFLKSA